MPELIQTPKWVQDFYDPSKIKPHYTVEVTTSGFMLHEIDLTAFNPYTFEIQNLAILAKHTGEIVPIKGGLEDLYEWSKTNNGRPIDTPNTGITGLLRRDPNYVVPMTFGMPSTSISSACLLASDYKDFLKIVEKYEKSPHDSITAFQFIDSHPMYWHFEKHYPRPARRRKEREQSGQERVLDNPDEPVEPIVSIVSGNGWARVQMQIIQGKFSFETSGTPYHTQTNYHDYGLDTYAKSMDEGICELAANIHAKYGLDGNLRNGKQEPND